MELMNLKGTKDFLPEEQVTRERIKDILVDVFKIYGFGPLETPVLSLQNVLASKYAGGAEILKEMYSLKDQGGRELALRYDLTIPFSRVIGMNPNVKLPFKRYEIGKVFRDGPVKTGRLREFTQCDVDVVGVKSQLADAEFFAIIFAAFQKLGIEVCIEFNNRKLLSGILKTAGVPEALVGPAILSIDKLKKIGVDGVKKELTGKGVPKSTFDTLFEMLTIEGDPEEVLKKITEKVNNEIGKEGIAEIQELLDYLNTFGVKKNIVFSLSLARGLEIYTGTVLEVFMRDSEITSSLAAGGRYDKIIGKFLDTDKEYPAVGISFGLDVIYEAVKAKEGKLAETAIKVFVIPIKTEKECAKITAQLRQADIATDMDSTARSISKNLDYANKAGIPYVIIAGQKELDQSKVQLKNMESGEGEILSVEEVIERVGGKWKQNKKIKK